MISRSVDDLFLENRNVDFYYKQVEGGKGFLLGENIQI